MSRFLRSRRRMAQAAALLTLAVLAPACGGGGGGAAIPVYGIATTSLAAGTVGTAYSQTISVTAGTAPFTFSLLSGTLPPGLALAPATGVISGNPTGPASGSFYFTVRVTDANAITDDQVLGIVITGSLAALTVNTASLNGATKDSPYSVGLSASGGTPGYTWAVTTGALPAGLALNTATGVISGTPTAAGGPVNFTVTVTDSTTATASQPLSITVNAPLIITTTSPLAQGTDGVAYTQTMTQTGGSGGLAWSIFSGIVPPGLAMAPGTGVLSGTPTVPGVYGIRVRVVDSASAEAFVVLSITINPAPTVTTLALVPWTLNHAGYTQTLTATGGTGALTWSVTVGALPGGLTLTPATGAIAGMPTAAGTFNFTVTATDTVGGSGSKALSIVVNPAITVSPLTLPAWTINRSGYTQTVTSAGGTGARTLSRTGTIPTGMTFSLVTGVLTGTPTAAGTFNFTVTSTDTVGATGSQAYAVVINPAPVITTSTAPAWTQNFAYTPLSIASTGGTTPFAWTSTGTLPTGITLNGGTGVLSGTPTATGTFNFTVTLTDAAGAVTSQALSIVINAAMAIPTATPLAPWTRNLAGYNQSVTATGGTGAQTWDISAGALPTSLAISAGGAITGTPSAANTFNFTVRVTDSVGATATKAMSILINDILVVTTATPMAEHTKDRLGYNQSVAATGGTGAQTWDISAGALPTSLSISAAGAITGTPTANGTFNFTVRVTDSLGATGTKAMSIVINDVLVVSTATPMAQHTKDRSGYNQSVAATGGTGTKTWDISAGALPDSLTLSGAGAITGTPTANGTFNFTVRVTDSVGATGTKAMTIVINDVLVVTTNTPMAEHTKDRSGYNQSVAATGGTGAQTWDISAGALPDSLSISAGGAITGTPTANGTFNFTVRVTDAVGATGTKAMSIVINDVLTVTTNTPMAQHTKDRSGYNQSVAATGGTGAQTWDISAGALPDGLAISAAGAITGTPTANGNFNFTVRVTDTVGATGTKAMSIVINDVLVVTTGTPMTPWTKNLAGYNQSVAASGGTGAQTWDISAGALPDGLAISAGGAITGTPTVAATFNFTVRVTDTVGATGTKAMSIVINDTLVITTTALPDAIVGSGYYGTVEAAGGLAPRTFTVSGGSLPGFLTLSSSGVISGTPGAPDAGTTINVTIQVQDSSGPVQTATKAFQFSVKGPTPATGSLSISTLRLPEALAGVAYSQQLSANGGTPAYNFTVDTSGNPLPAGLSLAVNGTLSGTPSAGTEGQYTISVIATDSSVTPQLTRANVLLMVGAPPTALSITTNTISNGTSGTTYPTTRLVATGGVPPYFWDTAEDSDGPQGMVLTTTGIFYGVPRQHGSFRTVFRVRDSGSPQRNVTKAITYTIAEPPSGFKVTNPSPTDATDGTVYSYTFLATSGVSGWITDDRDLSTVGLTLNPTSGLLSGTPTASGVIEFIVGAVSDVAPPTPRPSTLAIARLTIQPQAFGITTTSLPDIEQGVNYNSGPLGVQGGSAPFTWSIDTASPSMQDFPGTGLPTGFSINPANGTISGFTTASSGNGLELLIRVTDSTATFRKVYIKISYLRTFLGLSFSPSASQTNVMNFATEGVLYSSGVLPINNGSNDLTETTFVPGASAPAGLTLDAARRTFAGTPTVPGRYVLNLRLSDRWSGTGNIQEVVESGEGYTILEVLQAAGFRIATRNLPTAREGTLYTTAVLTEGGTVNPYAFSVSSGSLPPGLSLDAVNGIISGTPTVAGTYTFEITVVQGVNTRRMSYQLPVDPKLVLAILTDNLPHGVIGVSYTGTLSGRAALPIGWSDAGSPTTFLSLGLSLDGATGIITGMPVVTQGFYQVRVSAGSGLNVASRMVGIRIEPLPITSVGFRGIGFVGLPLSMPGDVFGGTAPYTVTLAPGEELAPGTTMSTAGTLSGTPTTQTSFSQVLIKIQDNTGRIGYGRIDAIVIGADSPALRFPPDFDDDRRVYVGDAVTTGQWTVNALGGTFPYTYAVNSAGRPNDLIPEGISLATIPANNGTADFTGAYSHTGYFTFVLRVTDSTTATADEIIRVRVQHKFFVTDPNIETLRVPDGVSTSPYPATQLKGYTPGADTWTFETPPPVALSLSTAGVLSSAGNLPAGTYFILVRHASGLKSEVGRIKIVIE